MRSAVETHKRSIARALKAAELRRQGLTFREIGLQIGYSGPVTIETARQAVKKGERILAARAARRPLPPDVLADALQNVVHVDAGPVRTAKASRIY